MLLLLKQILYFTLMKMYYAIGAVSVILIIIIVFRMFFARKKDGYDFDSLSTQTPGPVQTNENTDMLDRIGSSLGIKNFHEVTLITEELMKRGKKDEALAYLLSSTPLDKERAQKIIQLFESRFKHS